MQGLCNERHKPYQAGHANEVETEGCSAARSVAGECRDVLDRPEEVGDAPDRKPSSVTLDGYAPLFSLTAIRLLASQNPDEEWLDVPVRAVVHDRGKSEVLEKTQGHEGDAFWRR